MENNNGFHDGNRFFKHKYASIDLEYAINHIDSFADFEKYYTDELMDGNVLLKEYLTELLSRHKMKADSLKYKRLLQKQGALILW